MKVSIIIPCFNCETLIIQTLKALENQTYKNFEVICVNDGSKDNTYNVLLQYSKESNMSIRIFTQENLGVSATRNRAIKESKGEYILFLDADDMYHDRFVELLVDAMESTASDVSYCKLSRDFEEVMNVDTSETQYVIQHQDEAMSNLLYKMGEFGFYCYLYKKDILNTSGILFDENTRFFEDREFNWKYLSHCDSAVLIDMPLYWYRKNTQSVTQKRNVDWNDEGIKAVLRVEKYLEARECKFLANVRKYLLARVLWSKAKLYSVSGRRDLLARLGDEYNMNLYMKQTLKDRNWMVRLSSRLYLLSPSLFYLIVRLKRK